MSIDQEPAAPVLWPCRAQTIRGAVGGPLCRPWQMDVRPAGVLGRWFAGRRGGAANRAAQAPWEQGICPADVFFRQG